MDVYTSKPSNHIYGPRRAFDYKPQYRPAVFRRGAAIHGYTNSKEIEETIILVSGMPTEPPSRRHWKPDSAATKCSMQYCHREFGLIERRHHCRRCGDIFCGTHCSHYIRLDQNANFNLAGFASRVCDKCYSVYIRALDRYRYRCDEYSEEEGYMQKSKYQREYEQKNSKKDQTDNGREKTSHNNNNNNTTSLNDWLESYLKGTYGRYADEPYVEDHNNRISGHKLLTQSNYVVPTPPDWVWSTF